MLNAMGANGDKYTGKVLSIPSCTTNFLASLAKAFHEKFGIIKHLMSTVDSYTEKLVIAAEMWNSHICFKVVIPMNRL
ncbi:unnamed protein product [Rotaria sp. Silwood1]|nr:unnamed protein product [Rotaria sp. Silwood1]CAF1557546.1 unnamed protein product [Rotaria sp. Silwood1]CAF3640048.1 unnamed protein product [Rotaria sp. Silwood1]CAF4973975.1 unnamed protein product [Rotaria sp. Silwood1]